MSCCLEGEREERREEVETMTYRVIKDARENVEMRGGRGKERGEKRVGKDGR